jgi:hypothetical protein
MPLATTSRNYVVSLDNPEKTSINWSSKDKVIYAISKVEEITKRSKHRVTGKVVERVEPHLTAYVELIMPLRPSYILTLLPGASVVPRGAVSRDDIRGEFFDEEGSPLDGVTEYGEWIASKNLVNTSHEQAILQQLLNEVPSEERFIQENFTIWLKYSHAVARYYAVKPREAAMDPTRPAPGNATTLEHDDSLFTPLSTRKTKRKK